MELEFVVNDYLIAWYMLFKPSFSEELQELKEKLWNNYKKKYSILQKENIEILKYTKDFIPDDDTIYNIVFNTDLFKQIKKETVKYRQELMSIWDKNRKEVSKEFDDIFRIKDLDKYSVFVIHPKLDVIEYIKSNPKKNIAWGKNLVKGHELDSIIGIIYAIVRYMLLDFHNDNKEIVSAILDLAVNNELFTRISKESQYSKGYKKLQLLRRQLYPYWLMYLGCDKEDLVTYMMRDKIAFDIDKYQIERGLRKIDIFSFIDFCCKNQKYLIRLDEIRLSQN